MKLKPDKNMCVFSDLALKELGMVGPQEITSKLQIFTRQQFP